MTLKQSLWIAGFLFCGSVYCTSDINNPTPVYVVQGGEAVLQCSFGSHRLSWRVYNGDNVNIIASANDISNNSKYNVSTNPSTGLYYRLHILNVGVSDVRKYRCQATTINGKDQSFYLKLDLLIPPSSLNIENVTPKNNRLVGTEGQDLTVSCKAVGGKPAPNIILNIDGQSKVNMIQTAKYTLTTISRSYDRKTVTCQASNPAYSQNPMNVSAVIYLNLKPLQPTITGNVDSIEETKPLHVTCETTGSRPKATLQWTIGPKHVTSNATELSSNNPDTDTFTVTSDLTYSVGKSEHGQVLTCKAVNVVASSGLTITLDVKYAPTVAVSGATFKQNETNRTVACVPDGNPSTYTYYKWQHKYGVLIRELDGGTNGVLTLPSNPNSVEDRYQDSGEYVCTAGNGIVGRDGNVKQTGSGYVTINAQPIFTNDNSLTQYGEFGKNVDVNVYVYSIPIYKTKQWYRSNTPVSTSTKYVVSEREAIVNDTFYGKDVQLDGYSVVLTIKNLEEFDFNVSYRLQLSYGASQTVQYTVLLESASAPRTPTNFTLVSSTDTSIVIKWIPGYNGGHEQTFNIQHRIINESNIWMTHEIPQYNKQTYTLSGLQSNTLYELRMFAENKFDKSNVTDIQSISTMSAVGKKESQTGAIIGGVAGGLIGVILLLLLLAAVFYFRAKQDKNKPSKRNSSEVEDGLKENILYDSSVKEGLQKNVLYQSAGADYKPPAPNAEYAEVQKPRDVYAQVDPKTQQKNLKAKKQKDKKEKPKKGGKPKGKALNNNAFAEYSNAGLPLKNINDGEYANAEDLSGPSNSKKTTQGLEYADLSFAKIPRKGQKPKIHGADERTVYSDVDHNKRAPPLPEENPYEETNVGQVQK